MFFFAVDDDISFWLGQDKDALKSAGGKLAWINPYTREEIDWDIKVFGSKDTSFDTLQATTPQIVQASQYLLPCHFLQFIIL